MGPDGRDWLVGRRWLGEPPRLPRRDRDSGGGGDGWPFSDLIDFDDSPLGAILLLLLAIALIVALITAIWPLIALTIELLIVVVLVVAGVVGRVLFRRPWTIEACAPGRQVEWKVSGWRASGALVQKVCERIAAGEDPHRIEPPLRDEDQLYVR